MLQNKLIEGEELAIAVAKHAFENKAKKIKVLNLKGISTIADYFVICNVASIPQLKALRRDVDKDIKSIVNYSKIVRLIKKLVKNKHYNFLETLAEDVFDELFKDKRIDKISLQIEKLEIMKDCSSVGIQISKKRSHDKL